ncbi:MAG TPA: hypothetical protein VGD67_17920 [Pseudonocardiaceae bacterium]
MISYEEFGVRFFEHALTAERIAGALSGLVGAPFEVGPLAAGPGKVAQVTATGSARTPTAVRTARSPATFRAWIPVDLALTITLGGQAHRFTADLGVPLVLTAQAAEPLRIVLDITPPTRHEIELRLEADGMRATFLKLVAGIDDELKRFVARHVAKEVTKPAVQRARVIDVAALIDRAVSD